MVPMAPFFFHVRTDQGLIMDPEGSHLPDLSAAQQEALTALRQIVADRLRGARPLDVQQIEIADDSGRTLMVVQAEDVIGGLR